MICLNMFGLSVALKPCFIKVLEVFAGPAPIALVGDISPITICSCQGLSSCISPSLRTDSSMESLPSPVTIPLRILFVSSVGLP